MALEIEGKVTFICEKITGTSSRGAWEKQEFVITTNDQYPKVVCFATWQNKPDLSRIKIGDEVKVSFNVESRAFEKRYFSEIKAWKIEILNPTPQATKQPSNAQKTAPETELNENDDLPF